MSICRGENSIGGAYVRGTNWPGEGTADCAAAPAASKQSKAIKMMAGNAVTQPHIVLGCEIGGWLHSSQTMFLVPEVFALAALPTPKGQKLAGHSPAN